MQIGVRQTMYVAFRITYKCKLRLISSVYSLFLSIINNRLLYAVIPYTALNIWQLELTLIFTLYQSCFIIPLIYLNTSLLLIFFILSQIKKACSNLICRIQYIILRQKFVIHFIGLIKILMNLIMFPWCLLLKTSYSDSRKRFFSVHNRMVRCE